MNEEKWSERWAEELEEKKLERVLEKLRKLKGEKKKLMYKAICHYIESMIGSERDE